MSLYFISPRLTLLIIGTLPVVVLVGSAIGRILRRISHAAQEQVITYAVYINSLQLSVE